MDRKLEQRIARLERLLNCENKSCRRSKMLESREALDANNNVITRFSTVVDADGEEWRVIRIAPLDAMINRVSSFDNYREVSEYIDDNRLYDRNLMRRIVVLLRSEDNDQILCLEPENLELV
jgi:hypothetical protein